MEDDAPAGRVTELLLRDVSAIVDRFGPERVNVENVPYRPRWRFPRAAVEPEVIGRVARCGSPTRGPERPAG